MLESLILGAATGTIASAFEENQGKSVFLLGIIGSVIGGAFSRFFM